MASRYPTHQLSNGLYVSGRPEKAKEKPPTLGSAAAPYTGGDIATSGELGKMIDAHVDKLRKSSVSTNVPSRNSSFNMPRSIPGLLDPTSTVRSSSGSVNMKRNSEVQSKHEGEQAKRSSGTLQPSLPSTGLLTSGSLKSRALRLSYNQAVTNLSEKDHSIKGGVTTFCFWCIILLFLLGFVVGALIYGLTDSFNFLSAMALAFVLVVVILIWNKSWGRRAVAGYIAWYPDADLRTAKHGQFVKISGVVTCGAIPLETSYQKFPRCVYISSRLYEYRCWGSKKANLKHRCFTWGLRTKETYVADLYISDAQSGLRALVKTGYGAKVTPQVEEEIIVDINTNNQDLSREFARWLDDRNLSSDDRHMCMKEGYIREGSTISVMGVLQRNNNLLMIVPPSKPFSTGCQWTKCILPAKLLGIVLICEDSSGIDAIAV